MTYSFQGMRQEWRRFLRRLGIPFSFLHRDELRTLYGIADTPLPAIFVEKDRELRLWIDAEAISACRSLDDLEQLIEGRVKAVED